MWPTLKWLQHDVNHTVGVQVKAAWNPPYKLLKDNCSMLVLFHISTAGKRWGDRNTHIVSWCFEPSQPLRIIPGIATHGACCSSTTWNHSKVKPLLETLKKRSSLTLHHSYLSISFQRQRPLSQPYVKTQSFTSSKHDCKEGHFNMALPFPLLEKTNVASQGVDLNR